MDEMAYSDEQLSRIYDRTSGYCHICHRKLAFSNYGRFGAKGAWEVEHSNAQARGGTGNACNLYAACISCNRSKGTLRTKTARAWNGKRRAPLSYAKRQAAKEKQALAGGLIGGALGGLVVGPIGALTGAALGAGWSGKQNPDRW